MQAWRELRELNRQQVREDMAARRLVVRGGPTYIGLATDYACNLNCFMCARRKLPPGHLHQSLDPQLFTRFAEQVFPTAEVVQLNIVGEPLLSRNLGLELELAERYQLAIEIVTNGMLLSAANENFPRLVRCARTITVSFDAPDQGIYEAIREGAEFDTVLANLRCLGSYCRRKPPGERPAFRIAMVLMKRNLGQLLPMLDFMEMIGADELAVSYLQEQGAESRSELLDGCAPEVNAVLSQAQESAEGRPFRVYLPPRLSAPAAPGGAPPSLCPSAAAAPLPRPCFFLWERTYIDMQGNILACCAQRPRVMGNIRESSFAAIWNGEKYQSMRAEFGQTPQPAGCYACATAGYFSKLG